MEMTSSTRNVEFVALIAALFATIAISIDAMLPALPQIAATLSPDAPNAAQLVVTSFVFGMGVGTFFTGPLSDTFGRKPVILIGLALYALAALACMLAPSLEVLLAARFLQGLAVAAPRTVSLAIVRDLYTGPEMARIMSFAMMIFTIIPAIAPLLGAGMIALGGWHSIFLLYVVFAGLIMLWFGLRQVETHPSNRRRPLKSAEILSALRELLGYRVVLVSTLLMTLTFGALFATISSIQGIFAQQFGLEESFPLWFGLIALVSMSGSFLNTRIVVRLGMRRVVIAAYSVVLVLTLIALAAIGSGALPDNVNLVLYLLWNMALFGMMGMTSGNLNALAMEPVGHIAGLAASAMSSVATVGSVLLAIPLGLMFNGTALPLLFGVAVLLAVALVMARTALPPTRA